MPNTKTRDWRAHKQTAHKSTPATNKLFLPLTKTDMKPILSYILAVIVGVIIGSIVNMGLITIGGKLYPIDIENMLEIHSVTPFVFPFLAHALGTLVGAFLAAKVATRKKQVFAMVIGCWFLLGGVTMVMLYPAPTWFVVLDLVVAYLPMGYLGWKLADA